MQQAAFDSLGLPHRYMAFHVCAESLANAIAGAKALGFGGLNLTVPHKQSGLMLMDELSPEAEAIGAVNTVVFRGDAIVGHNTDGIGFVEAMKELGRAVPVRAVVLGAGGAARAVVDGLARAFAHVDVHWITRSPDRLRGDPLVVRYAGRVRVGSYTSLADAFSQSDLLVNTTSVGMSGGAAAFPVEIPLDRMSSNTAMIDLVYPRVSGGLLDRAGALGYAHQDGLPTLYWQGVHALELWLGGVVPEHARHAMRAALGG